MPAADSRTDFWRRRRHATASWTRRWSRGGRPLAARGELKLAEGSFLLLPPSRSATCSRSQPGVSKTALRGASPQGPGSRSASRTRPRQDSSPQRLAFRLGETAKTAAPRRRGIRDGAHADVREGFAGRALAPEGATVKPLRNPRPRRPHRAAEAASRSGSGPGASASPGAAATGAAAGPV